MSKDRDVVVEFDKPLANIGESHNAFTLYTMRQEWSGGPLIPENHTSVAVQFYNRGMVDLDVDLSDGITQGTEITSTGIRLGVKT